MQIKKLCYRQFEKKEAVRVGQPPYKSYYKIIFSSWRLWLQL